MRATLPAIFVLTLGCVSEPRTGPPPASAPGPRLYVALWFDTEDYILPASDDAARRLAEFLTREGIRATFKVVGEKARTLERRGRRDVIEALGRHEIGYHSNWHSLHPTPAQYLADLGWDEGVAEFERREGPGVEDLRRLFGRNPTCYGQPGSSWAPQAYGAMRRWGMVAYLDAGSHVVLDQKPHYYAGLLTLYRLAHTLRTGLGGPADLEDARKRFAAARERLLAEGGGVVHIFYHPCEWVHRQFWDGVNFAAGATPPRREWKLPPRKTPEETRTAFETFEAYIRWIKTFPDVRFITATDAARLYRDRARGRTFTEAEIREIAAAVGEEVTYQRRGEYALSAAEVFAILCAFAARGGPVTLEDGPLGPTGEVPLLDAPVRAHAEDFARAVEEADGYVRRHGRLPSTVWLGSRGVPPEAFLRALAARLRGGASEEPVEVPPARLGCARHVAEDSPKLWGWLFPPGFHAPRLMDLARRQSWTLKPAIADPTAIP
ncbi:MAG TPA: polysaccharide deacetylase family protein [Planctomycetota bacterium]|nr:polysaccharide deacetylase family protein [Planctomycetota bacterium]